MPLQIGNDKMLKKERKKKLNCEQCLHMERERPKAIAIEIDRKERRSSNHFATTEAKTVRMRACNMQ